MREWSQCPGPQGPIGPQGPPGANSTVPGPPGPVGPSGGLACQVHEAPRSAGTIAPCPVHKAHKVHQERISRGAQVHKAHKVHQEQIAQCPVAKVAPRSSRRTNRTMCPTHKVIQMQNGQRDPSQINQTNTLHCKWNSCSNAGVNFNCFLRCQTILFWVEALYKLLLPITITRSFNNGGYRKSLQDCQAISIYQVRATCYVFR